MGGAITPQSTILGLTEHDWKVVLFHVVVAMIQGGLVALGSYAAIFGTYQPYVMLFVQVASEGVRRYVN
jgi:hypothetical protein